MSAIAGLLSLSGEAVNRDDVVRLHEALQPYGPQGGGMWTEGSLGLAARLWRAVPEDAFDVQPLASPDGLRRTVFAGRLDNRRELGDLLGLNAAEMSRMPDSALADRAFDSWGSGCLDRLVGPYALACWDGRERALLLATAPLAGPSLFYHAAGDRFAFATSPRGLFALPWIPRALDPEYLAGALARRPRAFDHTFFQGIRRLPPGHALTARNGRIDVRRYYDPDLSEPLRFAGDEECEEAFRSLFARVVGDHLRGDAPMGILLSGGLDSSAVAAMALPPLRARGERLLSFTEVPAPNAAGALLPMRYADETPYIQAMARMYDNLDPRLVSSTRSIAAGLDEYFDAAFFPFRNACNRPWFDAVFDAARAAGCRSLLTGIQGNLTVSWPGENPLPRMVRRGALRAAWRESRAGARYAPHRNPVRFFLGQGVRPLLRRGGEQVSMGRTIVSNEFVARQGMPVEPAVYARENSPEARLSYIQRGLAASSGVEMGFRALYGVELRDPTADVRLVEFCLRLPNEHFRRDGVPRRLIRQGMRGCVPPEILNNARRGLQASDWARRIAESRGEIADEVARIKNCALAREAIDLPLLERTIDEVVANPNAPFTARNLIEAGLMTGSFIRWFEAGKWI